MYILIIETLLKDEFCKSNLLVCNSNKYNLHHFLNILDLKNSLKKIVIFEIKFNKVIHNSIKHTCQLLF